MEAPPSPQEQPVPSLDPVAAARWQQLARTASPWLHEEVGARMAERLDFIKAVPAQWLDWSPLMGGLEVHRRMAQRYPDAQVWIAGEGAQAAQALLHPAAGGALGWIKRSVQRWSDAGARVLAPGAVPTPAVDLLWANMALHQTPYPQAMLARWHGLLRVDGYLMFSCLGPDTFRELRAVYQTMGWAPPAHEHTDMHDWGDMLIGAGFAEPVMDMERITLAYNHAGRLLQDLRDMGRNGHVERHAALRGRHHRERLLQALEQHLPRNSAGQLTVTVEVVYGHAVKPTPKYKLTPSTALPLDAMRAMLKSKTPPKP